MCGIAGYVGDAPLADGRIDRVLPLMRHRGPDDRSHRRFQTPDGRTVELLHARLDIIDLNERSNQPFNVGRKWLSYNGELYNYLELRRELDAEGVDWRTECDTEVLLAAIDRWGWDALDRCEGMWGFAVYDEDDGSLTLVRDRFGEKPLYVHRDDSGLYFGSEPKFVFALLGRTLPVNERMLARYIVNGYRSLYKSGETWFEGLDELRPGHMLRVGDGNREEVSAYWRPPRPEPRDLSYEEAVEGTRERLSRSMELRLRADVPLAFCMSGGVDSVSLISTAKRVLDYDVHGFTILNADERYEERDMVEYAAGELGIRHTWIPLDTHGFLPKLRELVRHHDSPLSTVTYFVHWLLMESVAGHGYKISVSGTAADELFSGYYDHHLAYFAELQNENGAMREAREAWERHVKPIVRNPFLQDPDYLVREPDRRDHIYLDADQLAEFLVKPFDEPFAEERYAEGLLRNRMLNELFHETVPPLLHEDDLNAMYFSIENRSPFLDRELFEFSTTIPTKYLVRDGMAKVVLRDAMKGITPDRVIESRRKVGFNAPVLALLDAADPEVRGELLADGPVFDVVRRDKVEQLLDAEWLPNSRSKLLFNFVNVKLFLEEFAAA